ncbi:MAG: amidase domain-containing protein [Clostridia bacterium]|nr:amidase domain-containing protein [Clostridia bacterium]
MHIKEYNRQKAVEYANKWAYKRNPKYYDFDLIGGDCTNFVSQCIYAGSEVMNYEKTYGWYYNSTNDKSPSWTGVRFLYDFLINNKGVGPIGELSDEVQIGDVVQLSFDAIQFTHSLIIVGIEKEKILIASHSFDSYGRDIDSYMYKKIRFIHIKGVRKS